MSTPMYDIPEHFPVPVTLDGKGPAEDSSFHHWACMCSDSECRLWLDILDPYVKPSDSISDAQYAFPANLGPLLPPWDMIPDEFKDSYNDWNRFASNWFFHGFPSSGVIRREGIDAEIAHRHLDTIRRSYEPKHQHKIAAIAWLASRWWESIVPVDEQKS